MIEEGLRASEIAKNLNLDKQLISYHIRRLKERGYVIEIVRDAFKLLEVTQPGKNFLVQYENEKEKEKEALNQPICRLENIRFKAHVIRMPAISTDWKKVEMNNWSQYGFNIDSIRIHLNHGGSPSIEFIPSAIDNDDPYKLHTMVLYDCTQVAKKLEETLDMEFDRLELSSKAEFVYYDPFAKAFCKFNGQLTVDGIGKVNASKPRKIGELEFHDPRALADYMAMPRRLYNVETQVNSVKLDITHVKQGVKEIFDFLEQKEN
jgi:DNA-binding MarR family transcriptional regulator